MWSPLLGALLIDSAEWAGARGIRAEGMRIRLGRRGDVLAVAIRQ